MAQKMGYNQMEPHLAMNSEMETKDVPNYNEASNDKEREKAKSAHKKQKHTYLIKRTDKHFQQQVLGENYATAHS